MAPRGRKALGDVTNMTGKKEVTTLKAQVKAKNDENEELRAQLADLTAALEKTSISAPAAPSAAPRNPFAPAANPAALVAAPLPPKRGVSAYIFFMKDARISHADELAGKTPQEATAMIGQLWKGLSEAAKAPFMKQAEVDKARYETEMAAFRTKKASADLERKALEMHFQQQKVETALAFYEENYAEVAKRQAKTSEAKPGPKAPPAPKGARSAYLLYSSDRHSALAEKDGEKMPFREVTKLISEEWNALGKSKKKKDVATLNKYKKRAEADRARYVEEKAAYDAERAQEVAAQQEMAAAEMQKTKASAIAAYERVAKDEASVKEAKKAAAELEKAMKEEKRKLREEKKAEKAAKALLPKKPRSAYILFSQATRPAVVKRMPGAAPTEIMRELGAMWGKATAAQKEKYEQESAADKERYASEIAKLNN